MMLMERQGVVLPLNQFPELHDKQIGESVGELLGIQKYVKELPANLQGENVGEFPTHLAAKTDEENGLSNPELVAQTLAHPITITQKCDGSSCTLIIEKGKLLEVCSRNLSKKETSESGFWKAARKLNLSRTQFTGVIQGELCGPGIQKNPLRLPELTFLAFQIKKDDFSYMNYQEMQGFCQVELRCPVVPLVNDGLELNKPDALQTLQEIADKQTYSGANTPVEGIVIRPKHYPKSYESRRPLGFKILNRNYKEN
jgi:RNA ligase (TIGR02306 family)